MNILIYVSQKSNSKSAVCFGGLLARQIQADVTLLTVIDDARNLDEGYRTLDTAGWWISDFDATTSVRFGTEIEGIMEEIDAGIYDLVVLKARQAIRLIDRKCNKVDRRIAKQVPNSVLVVKQGRPTLNRILICTFGQEIAEPVIEMGARITQSAQAQATLLYVTGPVPSMCPGIIRMEETLPDLLQTVTPVAQNLHCGVKILAHHQVEAELELRHGSVPDEILREAHLGDYDLIVLGASKTSIELSGLWLGDVAQYLVDKAQCPVLVVR